MDDPKSNPDNLLKRAEYHFDGADFNKDDLEYWLNQNDSSRSTSRKKSQLINAIYQLHTAKRNATIKIKDYEKGGRKVHGYEKSHRSWTDAEEDYLKGLKAKKISNREMVREYNNYYKDKPRTTSSIRTKSVRLNKKV